MNTHEQQVEDEIKHKNLNAPRITKELIDALMLRVYYFPVTQEMGPKVVMVNAYLDGSYFLASGISKPVSPENFDAELGLKIATRKAQEQARNELWELESYKLYCQLNPQGQVRGA